jgi:hypothetical protein
MNDELHPRLIEGVHYYREGAYVVFTALYLKERGYCCESGCRHCPYGFGGEERRDGPLESDGDQD